MNWRKVEEREDIPVFLIYPSAYPPQLNPTCRNYPFAPFTDCTNGHGSYGGGRYLDLSRQQVLGGQLLLDFNRAYTPYCAY